MRYLYNHGVQGIMPPVRALGPILNNKPSAELQPKNEAGEVVQHDEDAMQRNFDQMDRISTYILYERVHENHGSRRLNAAEIFERCQQDKIFTGVDENTLYNMIRTSYERWTIAQHKIHASPISPTFGRNVDHQTSQRTPNIHGNSQDELTILGLDIMHKWAEKEGCAWSDDEHAVLLRRAWQDEEFVRHFNLHVWSDTDDKNFDLMPLYEKIKQNGWDSIFPKLESAHPIRVIEQSGQLRYG
jgi:hypothetical protein